jgi:perosamine synthetase
MFEDLIAFIRDFYAQPTGPIPLHAPTFTATDKELVLDAIDSTYVSSVGRYVDQFEKMLSDYTGAKRAVATVNGTCALQAALRLAGVQAGEEVLTQPLTFVATANAIVHAGAEPVFVDVDRDTMGMSPESLRTWLKENVELRDERPASKADSSRFQLSALSLPLTASPFPLPFNKHTGRRISAIVPMHTFGHPCRIREIMDIARKWFIPVVEDAAEALGSRVGDRHCGTFGDLGILSFNGNKTITCGGGGAILTNDAHLGDRAKHLTTTAKQPHPWEYEHDEIGYNFRLPNLNAALACAQLERLESILKEKRALAHAYQDFFQGRSWASFCHEPKGSTSNYWLNAIVLENQDARNALLEQSNGQGVMTRPAWKLMSELSMYAACQAGPLDNARGLQERVVNLPSGLR